MSNQLSIRFEQANTVRQNLRDGRFSVFVEYAPPLADQPFKLALRPGVELATYVQEDARVAALAITHHYADQHCHPLADVAAHLHEHCRKESLIYLSGRGSTVQELRSTMASLVSLGINTVVPVTGLAAAAHPRDKHGAPRCWPEGYNDSTRLLRLLREEYPGMCLGGTVNPFKYNIADVFLQYGKLVRKLNSGAQFLVAQAGWDMRKYQELQWYLQSRSLHEPCLARLLLLRPEEVTGVVEHRWGGLVMSKELGAQLQRESQVNDVQAMAAQVRRMALQAAGCRLLGYSGVQLAGVQDAKIARTVVDRVHEALAEFTAFPVWLEAWNDFHRRVELAPYPYKYYAFKGLLESNQVAFNPETCARTSFTIPPPAWLDMIRYQVGRGLRLERWRGPVGRLLRSAVTGPSQGRDWALAKTFYLSARQCPKGLEEGACGGSRPNGDCELTARPCFYHRVLALAEWRNDLEALERTDEPQAPGRD